MRVLHFRFSRAYTQSTAALIVIKIKAVAVCLKKRADFCPRAYATFGEFLCSIQQNAVTRAVLAGDVYSDPDSLGKREIWYGYRIQHQPGLVGTLNNIPCTLGSGDWQYKRQLLAGGIVSGVAVDSLAVAADSVWRAGR